MWLHSCSLASSARVAKHSAERFEPQIPEVVLQLLIEGVGHDPASGSIAGQVRDLDVHVAFDVQAQWDLDWFLVRKHDRQVTTAAATEGPRPWRGP